MKYKIISIVLGVMLIFTGCSTIKKDVNKDIDIKVEEYSNVSYRTYHNSVFGYNIDYPNFLSYSEGFNTSDGVVLSDINSDIRFVVYANKNADYQGIENVYKNDLLGKSKIIDSSLNKRVYEVRSENDEKYVYKRVIVSDDIIYSYEMIYPKELEEVMVGVIRDINKSFTLVNY
ncbi:hypothetical protein [Clostridium sp.]|uniref:hypothetical protein n=1 Tax=Clostridium sp. TaxID=1506 RepID=UPI003F303358